MLSLSIAFCYSYLLLLLLFTTLVQFVVSPPPPFLPHSVMKLKDGSVLLAYSAVCDE